MDGMNGIALLERIRARDPDLPVVVCTGYGSIRTAVEAIRLGATDYLTKPIDLDALTVVVDRALHTTALNAENRSLRRQVASPRTSTSVLASRAQRLRSLRRQARLRSLQPLRLRRAPTTCSPGVATC